MARAAMPAASRGFTLLEMLLALALGALLMATISTLVVPLLQLTKTESSDNTTIQAHELLANMEMIAKKGIAVFPTALDRGTARTSLAIQFLGTGDDMSADANQDYSAGIANMDTSADRAADINSREDDDRDGAINEDWINGIDDDNDGLIDEDPGDNDDKVDEAGAPHVDDNGDEKFDTASTYNLHKTQKPWLPFLPNSLVSVATVVSGGSHYATAPLTQYDPKEDDDEDGVTNNSPMITWTAHLDGNKIICTTPFISHQKAAAFSPLTRHYFIYQEYTCLENVSSFNVTRSYSNSGSVVLTVELIYESNGNTINKTKKLMFP